MKYVLQINLDYAKTLMDTAPQASLSAHAMRVLPVNQQDVFGRTALHVAASHGTSAAVDAILEYNTQIVRFMNEELPKASPELKLLLVLNLDLVNAKGQTSVMCAIRRADLLIIKSLLDAGADSDIQDDHKLSCLQQVCLRRSENKELTHTSSSGSITRSPSNTTTTPGTPQTPSIGAHSSSTSKMALIVDPPEFIKLLVDCSKLLLTHGADVSLTDIYRENVLHYACRRADTELLQTLLHFGRLHSGDSLLVAIRALYKDGHLPPSISARTPCVDLIHAALLALLHKEIEAKGLAKMTTGEVGEWLEAIGLPSTRALLLANRITGAFLLTISDETIKKDLGLETLSQRSLFINRLEELKDIDQRRIVRLTNATRLSGSFGSSSSQSNDEDDDSALLGLSNAKDYLIRFEDLTVGDVIGRGNFGEVRKAQWKDLQVAIKTIYRTGGETAKQEVYREMGILAQLRHPNILNFLGYVKHEGNVMMVTDLMVGGSLFNFIRSSFASIKKLRFNLVMDIVRGMIHLHDRRLVHRDLNTKNLLLDDHYSIKISDFGLSRPKHDHKMTMSVGFLGGMAPEVYRGNDYTEKADVFSFAMVLYEILTGKESHHELNNVMMYAHDMATKGYRPPLDDTVTAPEWNNLVRRCWATDPQDRPSFSELITELHNIEHSKPAPSVPVTLSDSGAYIT